MKKIVYYVAISLDGFICGENEDISGFVAEGNGVQKYLDDLKDFETVIMGRKTYEFGYKFGLKPGDPAYPHMEHYIFSSSLTLEDSASNVHVREPNLKEIDSIKEHSKTDVYLCGGGVFAGWLLEHQRIDVLKVKINPLILGKGVRLFGDCQTTHRLQSIDSTVYDEGLLINSYEIKYDGKE